MKASHCKKKHLCKFSGPGVFFLYIMWLCFNVKDFQGIREEKGEEEIVGALCVFPSSLLAVLVQ